MHHRALRHLLRAVAVTALLTLTGLFAPGSTGQAAEPVRDRLGAGAVVPLALRWAPIHHQDVDTTGGHSIGGAADFVTRVDFDGDWDARNNWEHAPAYPLAAYVYFSVVQTRTHWFLTYMFFHARDWTNRPFFDSEHENDAEGALLIVERDGSRYGVLRAAITVAHANFFAYTPPGSPWRSGRETVDGPLPMQPSPHDSFLRPVTAQESHGHGLRAYRGGDGVVYYPSTVAEVPGGDGGRDVRYRLIDVFEPGGLWDRRADPDLFATPGGFAGDAPPPRGGGCGDHTFRCTVDSAHAPWGWDDHDDGAGPGELATDPAHVAAEYFTVPGAMSRTYELNPYTAATP
jgi:hypothetical protein